MLKYLVIAATTAIVNLVLVTTNPIQIANAAMDSAQPTSTTNREKLITKEDKPVHINASQQSDIRAIHHTLTEFYRGLNEYNVDRMARVAVTASENDKEHLRNMFGQLKSYRVNMSIEVQNIELISLSEHNALVKITQVMKARGSQRAVSSQQSASIALVKYQGKWKISDSNTAMRSIEQDR
jgi:hypothetical protein